MEEINKQRLHSVVLSESSESNMSKETQQINKSNENTMDKTFICCFSNRWWFKHTNPAIYTNYDENYCQCCKFLDCCTWCLEFRNKKCLCCKNNVVCFMCCCTITFQ